MIARSISFALAAWSALPLTRCRSAFIRGGIVVRATVQGCRNAASCVIT